MRIDIWSDVVCPWCWIGKHRFQRGVELLGADAPALEIHWHAFQLDPDAGQGVCRQTRGVCDRERFLFVFGFGLEFGVEGNFPFVKLLILSCDVGISFFVQRLRGALLVLRGNCFG